MAKPEEINLRPGWLENDVKRAKSRLEQWNGAWERANAVLPQPAISLLHHPDAIDPNEPIAIPLRPHAVDRP